MTPPLCCALLVVPALLAVASCSPSSRSPRPEPAPSVTEEDLARRPSEPVERILQNRVPGITITRTDDGGIAMRIRGAMSYDGSDAGPLFIVNDLPFAPGPGGALTGIDPYDIESVKVLKGADAAIYGIDGANGVIVIKTKRPTARRQ